MKTLATLLNLAFFALATTVTGGCDPVDEPEALAEIDGSGAGDDAEGEDRLAEVESEPDKLDIDDDVPLGVADAVDPLLGLEDGQSKVYNLCQSLSLYQYNPAYHGTAGNPAEVVGVEKKLIWQTRSGTPNGWATVLSAGQEYWGWRYARVECLGGSWA